MQVKIQTWLQVRVQLQAKAQIGEQSQVGLVAKACSQVGKSRCDWQRSHNGSKMRRGGGGKKSIGTHQQLCN